MFDAAQELQTLSELERRVLAMLLVELMLPRLDEVTALRPVLSRQSFGEALQPVLDRQWLDLSGAATLDAATAERDARTVMSAIMENNTYLSEAAPGDGRADMADAALQALHTVVERSRTQRRSDGALIRLPFGARTVRAVLEQFARVYAPESREHTALQDLFERVRAAGSDATQAIALRAELRAKPRA